ncbi:dTDP-4-dehydrorhamnose reductase [Ectopseudomonas oleovorans]|uniref:dTDP-4-dehydrorhamnose reductase n=1 Tax=Ectopseudomonas oleovorans TaxID=301 RepID=UPI00244909C7|nr:dTDP-4-dehydrorhamnose reductase [Pseudomonas oleovorans]MDH2201464.1 dTDP-4-dehydrorhamnose reductase [Pseudomonas oleovorans]
MVKVLITGAAGQVGSELVKLAPAGFDVVGYNSSELDITNAQQVQQIVAEQSPALIINAAAYTAVDKAETDVERAYAVNETGVKNLVEAALSLGIPVFHISTDYVFDGTATEPYKETDPVGPTGVYGASKLAGEQALANSGVKHIILRTSWVFGAEGNNFVKTMLRLGKERDTLGVVADQHGCPTSAASIANVLWQLAQKYTEEGELTWGIYHFSNAPATTWYGFAMEVFSKAGTFGIVHNNPKINSLTSEEFKMVVKRPLRSVLDTYKIETMLDFEVPRWSEELDKVLIDKCFYQS